MLAATKLKMNGSEKKLNRTTYNISSIKRVVVVQNNGKEMYKISL